MDLTIITINYNSTHQTLALIESILNFTKPSLNYEIIVVDNNSEKNQQEILEKELPSVANIKLIKSKINLGFGAGNMLGFQFAKKSSYTVFVNNDVLLNEDSFGVLYNYMQKNSKVGVSGGNIIHGSDKDYKMEPFNHFYGLWVKIFGIKLFEKTFNKNKTKISYINPIKVDFIVGSLMFFRTKDFISVGGFDTNIFLYYEEMDICYRLMKNKIETHYVPFTTYIHDSGYSTKKIIKGLNLVKEQQISYHYVFFKCYGLKRYILLYFLELVKFIPRCIINFKENFPLLMLHLQFNPMRRSLKHKQKISIQ